MEQSLLVIANKNYSSWSMRGWLVAQQSGLGFDEVVIPLDEPETAEAIAQYSPSGLVPVLRDKGSVVWDSLAILEYLAERVPTAGLWPEDRIARAHARAIVAEMHSGFRALRAEMPMNIRASKPGKGRSPEVEADIRRITHIWRDCLTRFGGRHHFLFGDWCGADAFFAPVVMRFQTYHVVLDGACRDYADAVLAHADVRAWNAAAAQEPWAIDKYDRV